MIFHQRLLTEVRNSQQSVTGPSSAQECATAQLSGRMTQLIKKMVKSQIQEEEDNYEEAVGCKDSQAKDQWAGIEALNRTRIARRTLPLLRFFLSSLFNQPSTAKYIPRLYTHA